jgi:hypothetical protein
LGTETTHSQRARKAENVPINAARTGEVPLATTLALALTTPLSRRALSLVGAPLIIARVLDY